MPVNTIHVAQHLIMLEHPTVVAPVPLVLTPTESTMRVAPTPHRLITQVAIVPAAQLKTLV